MGITPPDPSDTWLIVYIVVTVRQEAVERQLWGRWAPWKPGQSAPSARALLLTLLGEFVLPDGGRAWAATLIEALSLLDVEARTARQAIARTARAGLLASERSGRRVCWALTPGGHPAADPGRRADLPVRVPDGELGRPVAPAPGVSA